MEMNTGAPPHRGKNENPRISGGVDAIDAINVLMAASARIISDLERTSEKVLQQAFEIRTLKEGIKERDDDLRRYIRDAIQETREKLSENMQGEFDRYGIDYFDYNDQRAQLENLQKEIDRRGEEIDELRNELKEYLHKGLRRL